MRDVLPFWNGNGMTDPQVTIMTVSEFLDGASTSDAFERVADEIAQEQNNTVRVDPSTRRDEEWGILANQVVGRENLPA
jgi:N-acetylglutamate synthase/N-acetylornithine aminotransferase